MSAFDCDVCGAPNERCGCAQDQTALRWERAEMLAARALAQHATLIMRDDTRRRIGLGSIHSPTQAFEPA